MTSNRGIDTDPGHQNRENRRIWRAIENLRSERRAASTTITDGDLRLANGGSLVVDGGDVVMLDDDGSVILRIGDMPWGDRGIEIVREDGQMAFQIRKPFENSQNQTVSIVSAQGHSVIAEEALGVGINKPHFPIPFLPVTAATTAGSVGPWGPQVAVASGTFVTTHQAWFTRYNRWAHFRIRVAASDTTTAGEVQVIDTATGTALAAFFSSAWLGVRPVGSTGYTELVPGTGPVYSLGLPGNPHEQISIAVQVRRTAGAGNLIVAVPEAHGWNA